MNNKKTFIKMQSKLYIDTTLIKITLLEGTVKENKANKWTTKMWNLERETQSSPSQSLQRHLKSALCFGASPRPSESLNWGAGPGGGRGFWPLSLGLLVVPLLGSLALTLYLAPALAGSQPGGGYQILPALFGYNRGGVRRGFLHCLSYVRVGKFSPKWCCSRRVEKALCRPEEFLHGKACEFFMLCGVF